MVFLPRFRLIVARLRAAGCVFAEEEARLLVSAARGPDELATMVRRRVAGLPLEHVVGWADFHGLRVAVEPGVFVPRRRSEFLVDQAVALTRPGAVLVDLCCGSGAVGAAVAAAVRRVRVHAVDIDQVAVRCARRNVTGRVYAGDLYQPLPAALRGRVEMLVANAPYVPSGAVDSLPAEARLHEPRAALDGGVDGLAVQRRVAAQAARWLAPGGHVLVETSMAQAARTRELFSGAGLVAWVVSDARMEASVVVARPRAG